MSGLRPEGVEERILRALRRLRYGSVEVVIHDSRVVQIECKEKVRVDSPSRPDRTSGGDDRQPRLEATGSPETERNSGGPP